MKKFLSKILIILTITCFIQSDDLYSSQYKSSLNSNIPSPLNDIITHPGTNH